MDSVDIKKEDILEAIYFISAHTQIQSSASMQGALSSKGDLMGGIFDRWINIIPESIVFNKILLPELKTGKNVKVISDYYQYNPKEIGIAPDVIGIRVNEKIVPFAVYDGRWKAESEMPQIEVKTFKKAQKMISLRNQGYDLKYLVMAETEFRIDYLMPFFDKTIFSESVYQQMSTYDSVFIQKKDDKIHKITKLNIENDKIGSVSLLKITDAKSFMKYANKCSAGISPHYIVNISSGAPRGSLIDEPLADYCCKLDRNTDFYVFNEKWYKLIGKGEKIITLNFHSSNIDHLKIIKINKSSIYVESSENTDINGVKIEKNTKYKIEFQILDRSGNKGEEYFFSKSIVSRILDKKDELKELLKEIISNA